MSRTFWLAVGAVGGIVAYRKTTEAAARAKELGALGTAQAAAQATSRVAGRTANGLGRLNDVRARRQGRLVIGSAEEVGPVDHGPGQGGPAAAGANVPTRSRAAAADGHAAARAGRTTARGSSSGSHVGSSGMSRGAVSTAKDGT